MKQSNVEHIKQQVDIGQISAGMVIKNYKEACKLLNEEICNGGFAKKSQINRWKRYFDFYKDGQKIIITEIYDVPFETDDARKRKEGLYVKYIELLLLEYLSHQTDYKASLNKNDLYKILGMTNNLYHDKELSYSTIKEDVSNNLDYEISDFSIRHFYQRADQKLNDILYSALKSMKDRFLIDYKTVNVIVERNEKDNTYSYRIADTYEDKMILEAKKIVLSNMGYSRMSDVLLKFKERQFYSMLDKYVNENYGWEYFYSQLQIIYIDDIAKQIPLKAEDIRKLSNSDKRLQLNSEILNALNSQAEKKFENNQNQIIDIIANDYDGDNDGQDKKQIFSYNSDYVPVQKELAKYLIKIGSNLSRLDSPTEIE